MAVVLLLAGGWHFSGQIRSGALEVGPASVERDLKVVQVGAGAVTLAPGAGERAQELDEDTTYGLGWPTGYGQVTDVVQAGEQVTRRLGALRGPPPAPGQTAALRRDALPDDPAVALAGLPKITGT